MPGCAPPSGSEECVRRRQRDSTGQRKIIYPKINLKIISSGAERHLRIAREAEESPLRLARLSARQHGGDNVSERVPLPEVDRLGF